LTAALDKLLTHSFYAASCFDGGGRGFAAFKTLMGASSAHKKLKLDLFDELMLDIDTFSCCCVSADVELPQAADFH
jgi:hypothetical protein